MEEAKELQLSVKDHPESNETAGNLSPAGPKKARSSRTLKWWVLIAAYSLFLMGGQGAATLLGRLYFKKGGDSTWLATVVQVAGFPILLPYYFWIFAYRRKAKINTITATTTTGNKRRYSRKVIYSIYVVLGFMIAFDCYLYSIGLMYIPVSTYSLICASQLAFNAFFSYFLNKQKFTPYIINCLVLLTISSVLLVFNSDSDSDDDGPVKVSRGKYVIGFLCTLAASAGYGLVLSLTQYFISNVLQRDDFRVIIDVTFWQSVVAGVVTVAGLFASGQWAGLRREMKGFQMGEVSYVMNLAWTAVTWQLFSVGNNGLIVEVSSLFSNVIGVLGLPIVPVFAVIFFGEKMNGIKAVAMVLAVWGFASYAYQNYLDGKVINANEEDRNKRDTESNTRERDE